MIQTNFLFGGAAEAALRPIELAAEAGGYHPQLETVSPLVSLHCHSGRVSDVKGVPQI